MSEGGGPRAALERAEAIGRRAADRGFDWPSLDGPVAKVREELAELEGAIAEGRPARIEAELGDLLFAVTNVARHLGVPSSRALEGCVARFEARFAEVERSLAAEGRRPEDADLGELEARWQAAKRGERGPP